MDNSESKMEELFEQMREYSDTLEYERAYAIAKQALELPAANQSPKLPEILEAIAQGMESTRMEGNMVARSELDLVAQFATNYSNATTDDQKISMAGSLTTLAQGYFDLEQYETSEQLMRAGLQNLVGIDVPGKAAYLNDHAVLVYALCYQSKFEEAMNASRAWMDLANSELVKNDIYTARIFQTQGDILCATKNFAEAEPHYKKALWLHENESCEYCSDVPSILVSYAKLLRAAGRETEAAATESRAQAITAEHE